MPEYLAPGVYIEEVSFRAKTIEGVSTSTAGFVGPARFGPLEGEPELLTSFADFERIYGGLDSLDYATETQNYLAHAVRAFFEEGGRRHYVTRVYRPPAGAPAALPDENEDRALWNAAGYATTGVQSPETGVRIRARYPGVAGNVEITFTVRVGQNDSIVDVSENIVEKLVRVQDLFKFFLLGFHQPALRVSYCLPHSM